MGVLADRAEGAKSAAGVDEVGFFDCPEWNSAPKPEGFDPFCVAGFAALVWAVTFDVAGFAGALLAVWVWL